MEINLICGQIKRKILCITLKILPVDKILINKLPKNIKFIDSLSESKFKLMCIYYFFT